MTYLHFVDHNIEYLQFNQTGSQLAQISLGLNSPQIISPASVYHIKFESSSLPDCEGPKCFASHAFQYFGDNCEAAFACGILSGNPCGDYELGVTYPNESAQLVCHENTFLKPKNLGFRSKVELDLWYSNDAEFTGECYFYCDDGSTKQTQSDVSASEQAGIIAAVTIFYV